MTTIQPVIATADLDRMQAFYTSLFGAEEIQRVPPSGPTFYVGLRIGRGELGLVLDIDVVMDTPQRILLSIDVVDVDGLLARVEGAGGQVVGPPKDMPWGQRVAHIQDPDRNAVNLTQPA